MANVIFCSLYHSGRIWDLAPPDHCLNLFLLPPQKAYHTTSCPGFEMSPITWQVLAADNSQKHYVEYKYTKTHVGQDAASDTTTLFTVFMEDVIGHTQLNRWHFSVQRRVTYNKQNKTWLLIVSTLWWEGFCNNLSTHRLINSSTAFKTKSKPLQSEEMAQWIKTLRT